jgi:steroid delta-isomerase-like uncharacterized protein
MSTETNKAICRRYLDQVWNERRTELHEEFVDENIVQHIESMPPLPGIENVKAGLDGAISAVPDFQIHVEDAIAEGDKVVYRWTLKGTHQGDYLGIPATGKKFEQTGVAIYRLADARIVEIWFHTDLMGLMQDLGTIPTLEAA